MAVVCRENVSLEILVVVDGKRVTCKGGRTDEGGGGAGWDEGDLTNRLFYNVVRARALLNGQPRAPEGVRRSSSVLVAFADSTLEAAGALFPLPNSGIPSLGNAAELAGAGAQIAARHGKLDNLRTRTCMLLV